MAMSDVLSGFLTTVAPTLASMVLGPMGGVAVAGIGKIFGLDNDTTDAITKHIAEGNITPDQLAEIRKLEMQYQNDEKERGFRYAELQFKDTDSARVMQAATRSSTPTSLTYLVTIGFFIVLAAMLYDSKVANSPPVLMMLGALGSEFAAVCKFWFGSTSGSDRSQELLANSIPPGTK